MFAVFSYPSLQTLGKTSLSTNCILSPYSEVTKRLLIDSSLSCQAQHYARKSSTTEQAWQKVKVNPLVHYIRTLKWTPIPLGLGFAFIAYQQFRHVKKRETAKILSSPHPSDLLASDVHVSMYTMLPLRAASRFWGWLHNFDLPKPIRRPLLNVFVSTYNCNLKEAVIEDIDAYKSLGDFFSRQLKKEYRPIYPGKCLVSPSDGEILHFGKIENGLIEQVKGITYSLKSFLGMKSMDAEDMVTDEKYHKSLLHNKDNVLYHCVVYLAPGDYHKFHSPSEWTVHHRKHFHGELLSVHPGIVSWIAGLFNINERVVYTGEWQHGFFSLTAVGATNVGSIKVYFDETLQTNQKKCVKGTFEEKHFNPPVNMTEKGQPFGEFNLGSTIVLIFEAPKDITFNIAARQKVKYGELISLCNNFQSS
ncbi:phosphatidylserine decarboxylase proenzyme, mitochondrial isoform X2 [Parasteatoda tepidariorum]|nr:phosphatidylserine decarboxylase proenzyme, mitochondrial isoform X2 [Parasteatoda tepidariorum]XP_015909244.1 phosphatidylserine decarboxylase proenzyme, mitochondrial isoform X2 [Parasteatoda tepidariorum]XP_042894664.1 phosphatidylserine decarboxylase proenzyme, mitochondrial isoform X2 [Parasteatoda tepidariorum]